EPHAERLTRDEEPPAAHDVRFELTPSEVAAFARGAVRLEGDLSNYLDSAARPAFPGAALLGDLRDAAAADPAHGA
ncbi:MAG: hypothetical protein ACKORC_07440, partial [Acidimicrobiia bacterium]